MAEAQPASYYASTEMAGGSGLTEYDRYVQGIPEDKRKNLTKSGESVDKDRKVNKNLTAGRKAIATQKEKRREKGAKWEAEKAERAEAAANKAGKRH